MKYQLIALDLDGTLLRSDNTLAPRTVNAVRRAVGAGAVVAIATGRMHASALQIAAAFGMPLPSWRTTAPWPPCRNNRPPWCTFPSPGFWREKFSLFSAKGDGTSRAISTTSSAWSA